MSKRSSHSTTTTRPTTTTNNQHCTALHCKLQAASLWLLLGLPTHSSTYSHKQVILYEAAAQYLSQLPAVPITSNSSACRSIKTIPSSSLHVVRVPMEAPVRIWTPDQVLSIGLSLVGIDERRQSRQSRKRQIYKANAQEERKLRRCRR